MDPIRTLLSLEMTGMPLHVAEYQRATPLVLADVGACLLHHDTHCFSAQCFDPVPATWPFFVFLAAGARWASDLRVRSQQQHH